MMTARSRLAGACIAALGVLGLTACSGGAAAGGTTGSPGGSSAGRAPHTSHPTSGKPTGAPAAKASQSAASPAPVATDPTTQTAANARLTFGEPAVIKTEHGLMELTVKDLRVAPSSVYAAADLSRANGTVYFVDYTVSPIKPSGSFRTNSVSGLFLYPTFAQGAKAKRLYGDAPGCNIQSNTLKPGQPGNGCYVYQITGARATTVTYNDYHHNLVWAK